MDAGRPGRALVVVAVVVSVTLAGCLAALDADPETVSTDCGGEQVFATAVCDVTVANPGDRPMRFNVTVAVYDQIDSFVGRNSTVTTVPPGARRTVHLVVDHQGGTSRLHVVTVSEAEPTRRP